MRMRSLIVFLFLVVPLVFLLGCGSNLLEFAADDSSGDSCEYKASKDLNEGDWQEVISSDCADHMQKAAAYFGLAGYDLLDIVDRMLDANDEDEDAEIYLENIIGAVSNTSLSNLGKSFDEYDAVTEGESDFAEADFNKKVFVAPIMALAYIKAVIDPDGNGVFSDCDINDNGTPDEVDATSCALVISSGLADCSNLKKDGVSYISSVTTESVDFSGVDNDVTVQNDYTGLTITLVGTPTAECTNEYKRLNNEDNNATVTTTSDTCTDTDGQEWGCPFEDENASIDIVGELTGALNNADEIVREVDEDNETELGESVQQLRSDICGTDGTCTNQEVSDYLQTL